MTGVQTCALPIYNPRGLLRLALGGWQTNGIVTIQTGLPFNVGLAVSTTNGTGSRPDRIGDGSLPASERTLQRWYNPAAFTTPAIYTYGNSARNPLFGPGRVNFDNSLFKDFVIKDEIKFQFRAEAFNIFNHPQFGQPNGTIGTPSAGLISSTVGNPRQIQLALRFQF